MFVRMQVLLARLQMLNPPSNAVNTVSTGLTEYKTTADGLMCAFLPNSPTATPDRTHGESSVSRSCSQKYCLCSYLYWTDF